MSPNKPTIVFLGSFVDFSAQVLQSLLDANSLDVVGVITTLPQPVGRKKELIKTPVHQLAEARQVPVATPERLSETSLAEVAEQLGLTTPPDLFLTAGYGKLLPSSWLSYPQLAALNLHFSLLPAYRGANPAEWALLAGETESGVTVIEMSPEFDTGAIVAQARQPLSHADTRISVYRKLYQLGGQVLTEVLPAYVNFKLTGQVTKNTSAITYFLPPVPQTEVSPTPYAKRLTRPDGFIPWAAVTAAMEGKTSSLNQVSPPVQAALSIHNADMQLSAATIERMCRALLEFPGLWTNVSTAKGEKRMKILATAVANGKLILDAVQIEGQAPAKWNQVKNSIN